MPKMSVCRTAVEIVFRTNTRFAWNTFGVHIESTVADYVPERRLAWFGNGPGSRPIILGCFCRSAMAAKS